MPSPFPGMDPFLEHPAHFPGLHGSFNTYLRESLQFRLPDPYFAELGERVWVELSQRYIEPDVNVLRAREPKAEDGNGAANGGGTAVAVAVATRTQPIVVHVPHDEFRETFVEIRTHQDDRERIVTVIEVLSQANKTPGGHGQDLYRRKQHELICGRSHLVEIDLLRGGTHTTAVPLDRARAKCGPFDYHVCIHRFDNLEDFFVYPVRLEERLPEIAVPLLPRDGAVAVDLQAIFERCYETGPYRRRLRYRLEEVSPPLPAEKTEWAKQVLESKGEPRL